MQGLGLFRLGGLVGSRRGSCKTYVADPVKVNQSERSVDLPPADGRKEPTPYKGKSVELGYSQNGRKPILRTTIFGTETVGQVSLKEQVGNDGGGPRFTNPLVPGLVLDTPPTSLPIMIYLPGIDGTGLAASRQFPSLLKVFELHVLIVPPEDRTEFPDLLDFIQEYLMNTVEPSANGRPVYLLGESFGGVLALATAHRCQDLVDRIVLVNPATSYEESIWPAVGPLLQQIPGNVYDLLPYALAPILGNPLLLLAKNVDTSAAPDVVAGQLIEGILQLFGSLDVVKEVLPQDTLTWKLELVQKGVASVKEILLEVPQRTLLLVAGGDWMLPSSDGDKQLVKLLPRCHAKRFEGRSHALLQEAGIDLVEIMKEEGFYVSERRLSTPFASKNGAKGSNFGKTGPIELPTSEELQRAGEFFNFIRTLASPVFFSTMEDGRVVKGFAGIPSDRPLLFVGNHQLYAPDTGIFVEELLREEGVLLRGLAHPVVSQVNPPNEGEKKTEGKEIETNDISRFLTTFGAVPVSANNFYKLLSQKENVLLYPGGVREAFKLRDEKYQLIWPEKAEFVRMAARFNATIVPLATIGGEDGVSILFDSQDILNMPIYGEQMREKMSKIPKARKGELSAMEQFVQPIIAPAVPQRFYFISQKPITTSEVDCKDKDKCQEIYSEVKSQLEAGLSYLIEKREADPYKDFLPRMMYERMNGGKQAPTFEP